MDISINSKVKEQKSVMQKLDPFVFLAALVASGLWFILPQWQPQLTAVLLIVLVYRIIRLFTRSYNKPYIQHSILNVIDLPKQEIVTITGKIRPINPLITPFMQKECVAYYYVGCDLPAKFTDLAKGSLNEDVEGYKEYVSDVVSEPFYLTDETGSLLIDPQYIELSCLTSTTNYPLEDQQNKENCYFAVESYIPIDKNKQYVVTGKVTKQAYNKPILAGSKEEPIFIELKANEGKLHHFMQNLLPSVLNFWGFLLCLLVAVELVPYEYTNNSIIISFHSSPFYLLFHDLLGFELSKQAVIIPFALWGASEFYADMVMGIFFSYITIAIIALPIIAYILRFIPLFGKLLVSYAYAMAVSVMVYFPVFIIMVLLDKSSSHLLVTTLLFMVGNLVFAIGYTLAFLYSQQQNNHPLID